VDILFASYQRIHSLLDKQSLYLSHLKWVVVDEIDTLYDTGKLFPILDNLLKRSVNSPQEKAI
jgi:superfamily II DNA/RNA helicase